MEGFSLYGRGPGPQNSNFWGVRIRFGPFPIPLYRFFFRRISTTKIHLLRIPAGKVEKRSFACQASRQEHVKWIGRWCNSGGDLFGMTKWHFQRSSDLQLETKKVTLSHLGHVTPWAHWKSTFQIETFILIVIVLFIVWSSWCLVIFAFGILLTHWRVWVTLPLLAIISWSAKPLSPLFILCIACVVARNVVNGMTSFSHSYSARFHIIPWSFAEAIFA